MKKALFIAILLVSFFNSEAQNSPKELLARSYSQASLSQEITKAYISIVLKIDKKVNIGKLQNSALTFSDELEELDVELMSIGMQDRILGVKSAWIEYRRVLFSGGYNKKKITKLAKVNIKLLEESQKLSDGLVTYAERSGIKMLSEKYDDVQMIQMVGQQSIYTHTIPSYYMLKTVGLKHLITSVSYHTCITNFEKNLQKIISLVDDQKSLDRLVRGSLSSWYELEKICTKLKVESESIEEFYPLLEASDNLAEYNHELIAKIIELGQ